MRNPGAYWSHVIISDPGEIETLSRPRHPTRWNDEEGATMAKPVSCPRCNLPMLRLPKRRDLSPSQEGFVLGNKVMVGTVNANREYFEAGVRDMAQAEAEHPGWLSRLLTHPVSGLEDYPKLFEALASAKGAIKIFCEIASL
jgi:hypothetical protein